jgi:hypothetical protein
MNSFAEFLNSLIREHPDTVSLIAQKTKISRPSLYDLINGKAHPRLTTFENLCSALSLSESSLKRLQEFYLSERIKYSKYDQNIYLKEKKKLMFEISTLLLSKGHEISRPSEVDAADVVLRNRKNRIPIIVCPVIYEHSTCLGKLLKLMYNFSVEKGYICTRKITTQDRSYLPFFSKYGIKILSIKNLLRELS